jgi:hypothetical protein
MVRKLKYPGQMSLADTAGAARPSIFDPPERHERYWMRIQEFAALVEATPADALALIEKELATGWYRENLIPGSQRAVMQKFLMAWADGLTKP